MLTVAAFGSSLVADPRVGAALKWIGLAYLLWLAWKIARAEPEGQDVTRAAKDAPLSFVRGALFQFVNPKFWVIVSGAVVTYGQVSGRTGYSSLAVLLALVFGTITFVSHRHLGCTRRIHWLAPASPIAAAHTQGQRGLPPSNITSNGERHASQ